MNMVMNVYMCPIHNDIGLIVQVLKNKSNYYLNIIKLYLLNKISYISVNASSHEF